MDLASISINDLRKSILKVASLDKNPYREAAKRRSVLLRDLPVGTKELAAWWVEHVSKYKGAEHLKSTAR